MGFANPLELLEGAANDLPPFIQVVFENQRNGFASTLEAIGGAKEELRNLGWTLNNTPTIRPPKDLVERILERVPNASPDLTGPRTIPGACQLYVWCHQEGLLSRPREDQGPA